MPFNVTMPDGTIVTNVPDGTTKDQFMSKYQSNFPDTPHLNAPSSAPQVPTSGPTAAQKPGFMDTLTKEIGEGAQTAKEGIDTMASPKSYAEGFKGVGKTMLGGMQAAFAPVEATAKTAGNFVTDKTGYPLAGKATEIGIDLLPPGKILEEAAGLGRMVKGLTATGAKMEGLTKGLYDASQATVDGIKKGGVVFDPSIGQSITKGFDSAIDGLTSSGKTNAASAVKLINSYKKGIEAGDTTLHNFFDMRSGLADLAGEKGAVGELVRDAVSKIDKVLMDDSAKGKVVAGDPESANLMQKFRQQWTQYKSHEALSDALGAESTNKIRAKVMKFVDSPQFKFLSPELQQATQKIARARGTDLILSGINGVKKILTLGGKSGAIGPILEAGTALAVGNLPAAIGIGGIMGASKAVELSTRGSVADILAAIRAGK